MEQMLEKITTEEDMAPDKASMIIQGVSHIPGWSEKNFQVRLSTLPDFLHLWHLRGSQ